MTTQEAKQWFQNQTKQEILDYLVKWEHQDHNPNWEEIQTWSKAQLIDCIVTDIEVSERLRA